MVFHLSCARYACYVVRVVNGPWFKKIEYISTNSFNINLCSQWGVSGPRYTCPPEGGGNVKWYIISVICSTPLTSTVSSTPSPTHVSSLLPRINYTLVSGRRYTACSNSSKPPSPPLVLSSCYYTQSIHIIYIMCIHIDYWKYACNIMCICFSYVRYI